MPKAKKMKPSPKEGFSVLCPPGKHQPQMTSVTNQGEAVRFRCLRCGLQWDDKSPPAWIAEVCKKYADKCDHTLVTAFWSKFTAGEGKWVLEGYDLMVAVEAWAQEQASGVYWHEGDDDTFMSAGLLVIEDFTVKDGEPGLGWLCITFKQYQEPSVFWFRDMDLEFIQFLTRGRKDFLQCHKKREARKWAEYRELSKYKPQP